MRCILSLASHMGVSDSSSFSLTRTACFETQRWVCNHHNFTQRVHSHTGSYVAAMASECSWMNCTSFFLQELFQSIYHFIWISCLNMIFEPQHRSWKTVFCYVHVEIYKVAITDQNINDKISVLKEQIKQITWQMPTKGLWADSRVRYDL